MQRKRTRNGSPRKLIRPRVHGADGLVGYPIHLFRSEERRRKCSRKAILREINSHIIDHPWVFGTEKSLSKAQRGEFKTRQRSYMAARAMRQRLKLMAFALPDHTGFSGGIYVAE